MTVMPRREHQETNTRFAIWCRHCGMFLRMEQSRFNGSCPRCTRAIDEYRCTRCGHVWRPKYTRVPKYCPECNSPYWNKEKMR